MRWRKAAIIGVGLLGGSLGLALKKRGLAGRVEGYVRRRASVQECIECGAVDHASDDLPAIVSGADLVVLCTPLADMPVLARSFAGKLEPETIVTDVGSVKGALVQELEPLISSHGAIFVGSHPMAGSEKMGVAAARADLFQGAACVVTPTPALIEHSIEKVEELWRDVGGVPLRLSPELHDEIVSRSSHLPHVLAAHLAEYVLDESRPAEQGRLCANGFKDCTRIAAGSPQMWRDIVLMNKGQLIRAIEDFSSNLKSFRMLLEHADAEKIEQFFSRAKALRDQWSNTNVSTRSTE
jgi:prephenate dehydrogenase